MSTGAAQLRERFREIRRPAQCPVCEHAERCKRSVQHGDDLILCFRVSYDEVNGFRRIKKTGPCSTYVRIGSPSDSRETDSRHRPPRTSRPVRCEPSTPKTNDLPGLDALAARCASAVTDAQVDELAEGLGVSPTALRALDVGWNGRDFVFPERDASGTVVGLCRRLADGAKRVGKGHRRGLYVPRNLAELPDPAFIVEGASDVAACLSVGWAAVGRPNATGGAAYLAELLRDRECVVVGENDQKPNRSWPGRDGAISVARALAKAWNKPVSWTLPPTGVKDMREYVQGSEPGDSDRIRELARKLLAAKQVVAPDDDRRCAPMLVCVADVERQFVEWLWPGRIPIGKLTLLAGDPGLGKSFVTLDVAARVSTARALPSCPTAPNVAGGVVLLSAEDDVADTIRPRLDAAGADVSRIKVLQGVQRRDSGGIARPGAFNLEHDLDALERAVRNTPDCRLVVLDPVSAYCGRVDSHRNTDVRGLLAPLADLAARHRVAIVAVTHLNKNGGPTALHRAMGSLAFAAAARAVWFVSKDKNDEMRRLFLPGKNNLAAGGNGLAYRLVSHEYSDSATVEWESEPVILSADDALQTEPRPQESTALHGAVDFLRELLADGPVASNEVFDQGGQNGFSPKTLGRAKCRLGIRPRKSSFGGGWVWALPTQVGQPNTEDSQDGQRLDIGNLRAPWQPSGAAATFPSDENRSSSGSPAV